MTFLTYFGIGLLVSVVVGVIGGIFWPESEEERVKRKEKKSFWWHMWHDSSFRSGGHYY